MRKMITFFICLAMFTLSGHAQNNEWSTDYAVFDDAANGPGDQVSSVAVLAPDRFVALVTETPSTSDIFTVPGNYLVGYYNADSALGRVPSPINGSQTTPGYGGTGKFTDWTSGLDLVTLAGAWQVAGDNQNRVYVANNDPTHNILVFELTASEVISTDFRMETGSENIFAIEVDNNGYVYVCDYQGSAAKTNEVRVYAGIGAPGTTWGDFGGHNDAPTTVIDLPDGVYQGLTVNGDGSAVYISATSQRSMLKFTGDPVNGYTQDLGFSYTMSPGDIIGNGGFGTPSLLGLGYLENPPRVYAAVDSFIHIGGSGGYPYARVYALDASDGTPVDTFDIAEWNLLITGDYSSGSSNGRAGGFGSVCDVDIEQSEAAVYTQTYYGWAVEKWWSTLLSLEQLSANVPQGFALHQNYPNPFNPATTIEFDLQNSAFVTLEIYNIVGQKVAVLLNEQLSTGSYKAQFDAADLPSGVYLYQLTAGDFKAVKKMMLTK